MRGYQSSETVLRWILRGAVFLVFCAVSALILFLCAKGAGTLGPGLFFGDVPALSAIFGQRAVWDGIWPACAGTACLVLLTMLIATLPGVGCGIYLAAFCLPAAGGSSGQCSMSLPARRPSSWGSSAFRSFYF